MADPSRPARGLARRLAATPAASPSGITLTPRQVQVGKVASVPAGTLAGRLHIAVPLGILPLHLRVTSVRVEPAGLRISAAGRSVHFATSGITGG